MQNMKDPTETSITLPALWADDPSGLGHPVGSQRVVRTAFYTKDSIVLEVPFSGPFKRLAWLGIVSRNVYYITLATVIQTVCSIGFGDNTDLLWWINVNNQFCQLTTRVSYQRGIRWPFKCIGKHTYWGLKNNWGMHSKNGLQNLWANTVFFILC